MAVETAFENYATMKLSVVDIRPFPLRRYEFSKVSLLSCFVRQMAYRDLFSESILVTGSLAWAISFETSQKSCL